MKVEANVGFEANVGYEKFPKQGVLVGRRAKVWFNYDTDKVVLGTIVRYDYEPPWLGIIKLDDGRHVLTAECHYLPP